MLQKKDKCFTQREKDRDREDERDDERQKRERDIDRERERERERSVLYVSRYSPCVLRITVWYVYHFVLQREREKNSERGTRSRRKRNSTAG